MSEFFSGSKYLAQVASKLLLYNSRSNYSAMLCTCLLLSNRASSVSKTMDHILNASVEITTFKPVRVIDQIKLMKKAQKGSKTPIH